MLSVTAFAEVGGLQGLYEKYPVAEPEVRIPNTTCHQTDPQAFKMLRDVDDDYMPWLGFLLGQTPGSIWYWCTDQVGHQLVFTTGLFFSYPVLFFLCFLFNVVRKTTSLIHRR